MVEATNRTPSPKDPYCGSCGYVLTGLTDSARCPECGKPLVEVLVRPGFAPTVKSTRYRSKATLFGLPVIDVAFGPSEHEPTGKARGIIAIGDQATGWLAIGGFARGIVAVGGAAIGIFSIGGGAIGLGTAVGGGAVGGAAVGGGAAGGIAIGGGAVGWFAQGGGAFGVHTVGPMGPSSAPTQQILDQMAWFFGTSAPSPASIALPLAWLLGTTVVAAGCIALLAYIHVRREINRMDSPGGQFQ